jgi:hypothetical protein
VANVIEGRAFAAQDMVEMDVSSCWSVLVPTATAMVIVPMENVSVSLVSKVMRARLKINVWKNVIKEVFVDGGNVFVMLDLMVMHARTRQVRRSVRQDVVAMVSVKQVSVFAKVATLVLIALRPLIFTAPQSCGQTYRNQRISTQKVPLTSMGPVH